jgi:hypothetical protein
VVLKFSENKGSLAQRLMHNGTSFECTQWLRPYLGAFKIPSFYFFCSITSNLGHMHRALNIDKK